MIIITGAAGFIGSCVASGFAQAGHKELVLVDDFSRPDKEPNHADMELVARVHRDQFFDWIRGQEKQVKALIHLGARTDTAEMDTRIFERLNLDYSRRIWRLCTQFEIPLVYASSAATYGGGEHGFGDEDRIIPELKPLNPYGQSKQEFDIWVLQQEKMPPFWAGLKFFNVYGPNEYHKGRMASVIFHAFNQIQKTGEMKLFRSHRSDYEDGEQMRDFIYVKDVVEVILDLVEHQRTSGIYNLGSGKARTFKDLVTAVFAALEIPVEIDFIDTPADIRDTYQYFTQAKMEKLKNTGGKTPVYSLEEGIEDYVNNYLREGKIF